ncbi:MAG: 4-oxalocrotonate decarboxylase [Betaproteobacteria bacterium]|nr:4-oxalocrotonate decarboxylase [Betaproteobacteria bacterium]
MSDLQSLAVTLDNAAQNAQAIAQLSHAEQFSMADAYEIQKRSIALRVARGAKRVGMKMGFTSRAKMIQMGLFDMIWGRLTADMVLEDGAPMPFKKYVHPRVEPEIAFLLKKPLIGSITPMQALAAVEAIAPAMEVIDSRYANFKFALNDVVADNASSSGFVTGPWNSPTLDFSNLGLVMSFNGRPVQIGSTAGILGHPLRSLVAAARFAEEAGEPLEAGWIVMAGGATAAEALKPGTWVEMEMQSLGRVAFNVAA